MSMASLISFILSSIIIVVLALFFLLSTSHCLNHRQPTDALRAEKTRLGSTPPSCHNKCNECHPCMAVQVPTLPIHKRIGPSSAREKPLDYFDNSPSSAGNRYSNYKPLGWKCKCDGHFYNP